MDQPRGDLTHLTHKHGPASSPVDVWCAFMNHDSIKVAKAEGHGEESPGKPLTQRHPNTHSHLSLYSLASV